MTREDKDSLVEMLAKIPITETRGSLLSAIGNLLRVIDISENSIMIPTLLKDKCEFDAYEMLTLAKILKASILGHNDLVEFYMSESSSQLNSIALQHHHHHHNQHQHQHQHQHHPHQHQHQRKHQRYQHNQKNQSTATTISSYQNSNISSSSTNSSSNNANTNLQIQSISPSLRSSLSDQSTTSVSVSISTSTSPSTSTSSPISTPSPSRAELLGSNGQLQLNNGDPDATIRLLLQIEQLKTFIPQVTGLFEGIIELYKNSVDTITCQTSRSHK